jgi:hypothetical protein
MLDKNIFCRRLRRRKKWWQATSHANQSTAEHLLGDVGEYDGLVGEYDGLVGEYDGLVGEYDGLVGEYDGDVGEYDGDVGLSQHSSRTNGYENVARTEIWHRTRAVPCQIPYTGG